MIEKMAHYLEYLGCICIAGAFCIYYIMWRESDLLWWIGLALVTPKIIASTWNKSISLRLIRAVSFVILILLTRWWFGGPVIKADIPGLPTITIERQQQYKIL